MNNTICPYTTQPVASIQSSREHIVPDALGGPNAFALAADKTKNSTYGQTVDARLINSPLMGMLAARAGVETRSGPSTWSARGELLDGAHPVDVRGSGAEVGFRLRKPVDIDSVTGMPKGVMGFGEAAEQELARVTKDLERKGMTVVPGEQLTRDPTVHVSINHNLAETAQGLGKIAYLATVRVFGDAFINTAGAAQYRSWIDAELTTEALQATGLLTLPPSVAPQIPVSVTHVNHVISCWVVDGRVFTMVSLFNAPLFTRGFLVATPELTLPPFVGKVMVIDAAKKTLEEHELRL